jgi:hypothetical protein
MRQKEVIDMSITPEVLAEDRRIIKAEIDHFLMEKMISFEEAIEVIVELQLELEKEKHHSLFSFRVKK